MIIFDKKLNGLFYSMNAPTELKDVLKLATDKQLAQIISHGVLKLTDTEVDTISFVFWIIYMAEWDLYELMVIAWNSTKKRLSLNDATIQYLRKNYKIKNEIIDPTDPKYSPNDITFTDRIDIYQKICGSTKLTKFLWKLKDIRNDLSHGRIKNLKYNNASLYLRETREKILLDFIDSLRNNDWQNAAFWQNLTEEEKEEMRKRAKQLMPQM
jgi:hypothetical protein